MAGGYHDHWRQSARDHKDWGNMTRLLAAYNSLTDKHLAGYFNNTRIRRHLLRSGLITRSGRILSEKEYKLNIMKRDHQKYIRECLAQAIFHKVLDMERYHQLEIKKKLETLARKERVQRFKQDPTKQSIENNMPILSPRPPVGQKSNLGQSVLIDELHSSPLTRTAPRPYTAPGNMQPPIRLQPLSSNPSIGTVPKITTRPRSKTSMLENETPFPIGGKKAVMKFRSSMENSWGTNLYQLPNINNYMMPIPPPPPLPDGKFTRENRAETWRRRRFRPITASNGLEPLFTKDSRRIHKTSLHSNAAITMIYFGKNVHLSYDDSDFRDEIKVYQQHCGGENLCVYKGKLLEKETFQFISKRHHGFPFSLTFFLNGIQVNRLSSCCEYKHRKGSRLGGKRGYFGFVCVERSSPCYKCIIAMGLDKKTSSSKTRKENAEKREELKKSKGKLRKDEKYMIPRRNEIERNRTLVSAIFSAQEEEMGVKEVRTAMEEMERKGKPGQDIWEDDQENTFKYEYEEDFEVDEEKQDEKTNEEGQADDQMNGMSKSPSDDEKDNLDPEKESETSSQKAPDADDNVKDESDGRSVTELEEDKQDRKTASSISSRSHRNSSCSEEESSVEDRDAHTENSSEESARSPSSRELSENDESGKPHLPVEESLETETLDQEIIKAEVETKPVPAEENYDNALKEEMEEGAQVTTEGLSVKSRDHISKEEKEKTKRKLWEGSTTNAKDEKAGSPGVKKGGKDMLTLFSNLIFVAPNENLVVEERTLLNLNKEPKQVAPEMYTLEKKAAIEENEVPQPRDADRTEQKGEATLWGKIGVNEVPLGEWKVTGVQPALAEQFTMEREVPQDIESGTRVAAEGDRNVGREGLNSTEKEGVGDSANLNEGEAPEEQGLVQTVLEIEKAVSEGEQGSEDSALRSKAAALREAAMPPEKGDTTGAAVSEAGSEKPDEEENKEEASTDLENTSPVEEAASKRKDASEKALLGGEEPAKEWEEVMGIETPLSSSVSEKEGVNQMNWEDSFKEERKECKKDMEREKVVTEAESNREDDRKEMLSEELDAAGERKKAERLKTHLRDTESEKEEVKRANALKHEYASEEGKKEEKETVKENRPDGKTKAPTKEMDSESADKVPMEESEVAEDAGLQRKDSLKARGVVMCEAVLGPEKSLENITALRKGGEERLTETRDTEHKFRVQLLPEENVAPSEKDEGPQYDGESVLGTPESELAGKAQGPEVIVTTGEDEECAAEDQDRLAGPEGRDTEGPLQGRKGIGDLTMTQGDVPEEDSMIAEKFNEEAMGEDMEEGEEKCSLGRGIMKNRSSEGERSLTEEAIAEEDLNQGETTEMTMEKREELADAKRSEEKIANIDSSFADIAGEETWHKVDELVGKTAAAERVVVEGIALSQEKVQAVEEVTVTSIAEVGLGAVQKPSNLEGGCPQLGYDQEGGEEETTPQVGLLGEEEEGMGSSDKEQEPGAAEAFRQRLPWETEVELKRESPQAVETLPIKPDFTETQEKPKHMVQRESENADVSGNHVEA
ncbi:glutamate-rich protein 3 [Orycteropus afer afer]|uniref:Glutamate-rich protein 3 n=1 Tax=Orycteropus afer afer TaxID=1230840 RepID=A0A8B7AJZ3_ORYAF|nr:glutamate-rich protein 3 [Orycteropus afer afer]